jgi:hypothetical protein
MMLRPLSTAASFLLAAASLAAQTSILPYLPKDTMMVVSAPDLLTSAKDFQQMPLAKMWAEEEVQIFFADAREMLMKQFDQGMAQAKEMYAQGQLPIDPAELLKLGLRNGTFAVTKLGITKGEFRPQPEFGFVLHLDFGDSAPAWNKLLQTGLSMLEKEAGDDMVKKETKVGEVTMMSLLPNAANAPNGDTSNRDTSNRHLSNMGLNVAMVPGGVLIGTLGDEIRGVLEAMQQKAPALATHPQYTATAKHLTTSGAECEMFVRPQPVIDLIVNGLQIASDEGEMEKVDVEGVKRAIAAMGWNDLGAMGATSTYEGGKCVSRSFAAHGKISAAATSAAAKTIDTSFLKWVPKNAVGFSAGTIDVMSIYDMFRRGIEAYDPEVAKQAMGQLAQMEKQMGFTVQNDLFGSIGDHYISWSMPMGSIASAPEMAFLVKVTDETKIVNVLKGIARMSDGKFEIEEGEKRGVKHYQLRLNVEFEGMAMNPFEMIQPAFAFKNGYMVGAFSIGDIKRVFARMDREDDPKDDIRANKEFAAVQGEIPAGISSVSFTDWKIQFESFYQIVTGLLGFVPIGDEIPIDMQLLPESGTLTKHLFGALSWSKTDAVGTTSVSTSPFGPELMLAFGGALVAGGVVATRVRGGF